MKRIIIALTNLFDINISFLPWWQEIILNWVATWDTVSIVLVVSSDGQDQAQWDAPADWELDKINLEQQWEADQCRDT
jgi:hypothetical protein